MMHSPQTPHIPATPHSPQPPTGSAMCVVCLDESPGVNKMPCTVCKDKFAHAECLLPWILRTGSCPTCRACVLSRDARRRAGGGAGDGGEIGGGNVTVMGQEIRGMEMAPRPYLWPWCILMFNIISSFGIYMTAEGEPRFGKAELESIPGSGLVIDSPSPHVYGSMDLFLGVSQYLVLFLGIFHMVTYYAGHHHILARPTTGFLCWLMFMAFVAVLSPFVYALSHTCDSVLLIMAYAVLVVSAVPAIALRSHMWRLSNVTTSILFCCSALAMKKKQDVRLVLIITLFGHYLVIATVIIARTGLIEEQELEEERERQQQAEQEEQEEQGVPEPQAEQGVPEPQAEQGVPEPQAEQGVPEPQAEASDREEEPQAETSGVQREASEVQEAEQVPEPREVQDRQPPTL